MKTIRLITFCVIIVLMASCAKKVKIDVKSGIEGKGMAYIEHVFVDHSEIIDSTEISRKGNFSFKIVTPQYPELYRVRTQFGNILLGIDSVTENISVIVPDSSFFDAQIEGSEQSADIQRLRKSNHDLQYLAMQRDIEGVEKALANHKTMGEEIILKNPQSAAAYYAINQTFKGNNYVNPYTKRGLQMWSAVATAYNIYYPEYERSKELKAFVVQAIKIQRGYQLDVDRILESAEVTNIIDIELPNSKDEIVRLSSLTGKVVLIDFSAYSMEQANAHIMFLRELYDKYKNFGFEIYQMSVDPSRLQWLEQSRNMPWVCVWDSRSTTSPYILSYNITEIPTFFLMSQDGTIVGRYNHENIENAIKSLLKNDEDF
mgnify:CR=1 FL=1